MRTSETYVVARATALLAGNGLALVQTMSFIQAEAQLQADAWSVGAAATIPLLGAFSAYRMLRLAPDKTRWAELTSAICIVVQAALWVAFTSNLLGPK